MKQYQKAVDHTMAIANKCYWCISREYDRFDCQFSQGTYFALPCSKDDYKKCPEYKRGENIIKERGW